MTAMTRCLDRPGFMPRLSAHHLLRPRLAETLTAGLPVTLAELDALGGYTPATAQGYEQVLEKLGNDLAGCLEAL